MNLELIGRLNSNDIHNPQLLLKKELTCPQQWTTTSSNSGPKSFHLKSLQRKYSTSLSVFSNCNPFAFKEDLQLKGNSHPCQDGIS